MINESLTNVHGNFNLRCNNEKPIWFKGHIKNNGGGKGGEEPAERRPWHFPFAHIWFLRLQRELEFEVYVMQYFVKICFVYFITHLHADWD